VCEIFTNAYSYVKNRVSPRNENRPKGRFSCASVRAWPYGLSAPKSLVFRFVDTYSEYRRGWLGRQYLIQKTAPRERDGFWEKLY
jgi:hypothetical protein